jgi:hypothetical protein
MRRFIALISMVALTGTVAAQSKSHRRSFANFAGGDLGKSEAAATCAGHKLNSRRRDEIMAVYAAADLKPTFERAREQARNDRLQAMRQEPATVCNALLQLFGPRGLLIPNYVQTIGVPDLPDAHGYDRGVMLDADPRGLIMLTWIGHAGTAYAITTFCTGYAVQPLITGHLEIFADIADRDQLATMITVGSLQTAKEYGLDANKASFCKMVLAKFGPDSTSPLVIKKR